MLLFGALKQFLAYPRSWDFIRVNLNTILTMMKSEIINYDKKESYNEVNEGELFSTNKS